MGKTRLETSQSTVDMSLVEQVPGKKLKDNLRAYTMVFALLAIWLVLAIATQGTFLEPRNLSNLFRQTAINGYLAIGMVFVITAGHIDLSVGAVAGLTGAIAAMLQVQWLPTLGAELGVAWLQAGWPSTIISIVAALIVGTIIGIWQGAWVAYGQVPAFIVTLGGLLIFRGAILGITKGINIGPMNPTFQGLGQAYLSHTTGIALAIASVALIIVYTIMSSRNKLKYDFPVKPLWTEVVLIVLYSGLVIGFVIIMNRYRGVPIPVVLLIVIAVICSFIFNRTQLGRYTCAIGGNLEAARLSGLNVRRVMVQIFALMGILGAIAGIVLTARLNAATANAGNQFELNAIASCVIGGTSLQGGSGSIPGALLGALVMASIDNGLSMLNVQAFWQQIIKGLILMVAVLIDVKSR
ncbi:MAG TPA: sugar ABC transporter permease [Bacillota bacterium]|nr:sugar ABC transporter permease [Bacillota bacterium]